MQTFEVHQVSDTFEVRDVDTHEVLWTSHSKRRAEQVRDMANALAERYADAETV